MFLPHGTLIRTEEALWHQQPSSGRLHWSCPSSFVHFINVHTSFSIRGVAAGRCSRSSRPVSSDMLITCLGSGSCSAALHCLCSQQLCPSSQSEPACPGCMTSFPFLHRIGILSNWLLVSHWLGSFPLCTASSKKNCLDYFRKSLVNSSSHPLFCQKCQTEIAGHKASISSQPRENAHSETVLQAAGKLFPSWHSGQGRCQDSWLDWKENISSWCVGKVQNETIKQGMFLMHSLSPNERDQSK